MNNKGILITFLIGILIGGIASYFLFAPKQPSADPYQAIKDIAILQDSLELIVRNDSAIMDQMRVLQANPTQIIYVHDKADNVIDTLDGNANTNLLRSNIGSH